MYMYLIQFRLQFFINIHTFYTRNSDYYIKPRDCKHGRPQVGGARISRRPPPRKKFLGLYLGAFLLFFLHMRALLLRFSYFWGSFRYFLLHGGGPFFWAYPPPPTKFLRAPMIARRVREHAPRKCFYVTAI